MNTGLENKDLTINDAKPVLAPVRVLNLYACLGGNRLLWKNCEVTAVELDPELARLYQERFLNSKKQRYTYSGCTFFTFFTLNLTN